MRDLVDEARVVMHQAECLHDWSAVDAALGRMAAAIEQDMGRGDVLLLCVMNGGLVAAGALLPRLGFPLRVDYMHASRYRERLSGDRLDWRVQPAQSLRGRDVLVVDDILDEGYTLEAILEHCQALGPNSLRAAVLVQKLHARGVRPPVDYVGLQVPDRYVFGCGMDYKGYWRNAPGIFAVAE